MRKHWIAPLLIALAWPGAAVCLAQEAGSEGPAITVYPAFHLRFAESGKNYLLASVTVVNVSGQEIRNLTLSQALPENLIPAPAPDGTHEFLPPLDGFVEEIAGNTYTIKVPVLRRRELTSGFFLVTYKGRPAQADLPAAKVAYTMLGQARTDTGPALTLELTKYSKYSGSLSEYLKRYAGMQIRIPEAGAPDWGFSGLASRLRAKTPLGVVELEGDAVEGRFSLLSGAPGDTREILMAWKPLAKAKRAGSEAEARKLFSDQTAAAADLSLDMEAATLSKEPLARGESWTLATRWKDRVAGRLGEGPIRWYVYEDPQKSAQYLIMTRAQGRGSGPGKADVANPEKEAALMSELDSIVKSFKPL